MINCFDVYLMNIGHSLGLGTIFWPFHDLKGDVGGWTRVYLFGETPSQKISKERVNMRSFSFRTKTHIIEMVRCFYCFITSPIHFTVYFRMSVIIYHWISFDCLICEVSKKRILTLFFLNFLGETWYYFSLRNVANSNLQSFKSKSRNLFTSVSAHDSRHFRSFYATSFS